MKRFKIYLKCGHVVEFDSENLTTKRNGLGNLTGLEWNKKAGTEILHTLEVDEIAAITYTEKEV